MNIKTTKKLLHEEDRLDLKGIMSQVFRFHVMDVFQTSLILKRLRKS